MTASTSPFDNVADETIQAGVHAALAEIGDVLHPAEDCAKPWREVSSLDVRDAIAGTNLEPIVGALQAATKPTLPPELTMPKAIVLAGCALSQPRADFNPDDTEDEFRGTEHARLVINTASWVV